MPLCRRRQRGSQSRSRHCYVGQLSASGRQVISHFHLPGFTESATYLYMIISTPSPTRLLPTPTGAPCCSSGTKGGVPDCTDRSEWRSDSRKLSHVLLPTCGHHFPGLYNAGLPSCGLLSQGSKPWTDSPMLTE